MDTNSIKIEEIKNLNDEQVLDEIATVYYNSFRDRFYNKTTIKKNCIITLKNEKFLNDEDIKEENKLKLYAKLTKMNFISNNEPNKEFYKYGGDLSVYPNLEKGQTKEYFKKVLKDSKKDSTFKVFVARQENNIIGLVKGNPTKEIDKSELYLIEKTNYEYSNGIPKGKIYSLGSLYVDPKCRTRGVGTKLLQYYTNYVLKNNKECDGMITDAYLYNNSQYFFSSRNAERIGLIEIPDGYIEKGEYKTQIIPGEVMFWSRENMEKLVENKLVKDEKQQKPNYTRNTAEYSLLVACNEDFDKYKNTYNQQIYN